LAITLIPQIVKSGRTWDLILWAERISLIKDLQFGFWFGYFPLEVGDLRVESMDSSFGACTDRLTGAPARTAEKRGEWWIS
jgi:hypothetical protein